MISMKVFHCYHCKNQAISNWSFFCGLSGTGIRKETCRNCGKRLKVDFLFYLEFFTLFFVFGLILRYLVSFIFFSEKDIPNSLSIGLNILSLVVAYSPVWIFQRRILKIDECFDRSDP